MVWRRWWRLSPPGPASLVPFALGLADHGLAASAVLTFTMMFTIGALRGLITIHRWWVAGLEMLLLGMVVDLAAYGSGLVAATLTQSV
jgi:hypothetical protein